MTTKKALDVVEVDVAIVRDPEAMINLRWKETRNGGRHRLGLRLENGATTLQIGEAFRNFGQRLIAYVKAQERLAQAKPLVARQGRRRRRVARGEQRKGKRR